MTQDPLNAVARSKVYASAHSLAGLRRDRSGLDRIVGAWAINTSPNALGIHNSQSNFDLFSRLHCTSIVRLAALQCRKKGGLLRSPIAFSRYPLFSTNTKYCVSCPLPYVSTSWRYQNCELFVRTQTANRCFISQTSSKTDAISQVCYCSEVFTRYLCKTPFNILYKYPKDTSFVRCHELVHLRCLLLPPFFRHKASGTTERALRDPIWLWCSCSVSR